jgi:hypothetical protein
MITFVDHVGRTVIGELKSQTKTTITVENPVIIHVQPNPQNGQLQVQSFPYLFVEFIDRDSRDTNVWTFDRSSIAVSTVVLDDKIVTQYKGLNTPPAPAPEPEVVKLFEED